MTSFFKKLVVSSYLKDATKAEHDRVALDHLRNASHYADGNADLLTKVFDVAIARAENAANPTDALNFIDVAYDVSTDNLEQRARVSDTAIRAIEKNPGSNEFVDLIFTAIDASKNNPAQRNTVFNSLVALTPKISDSDTACYMLDVIMAHSRNEQERAKVTDTAIELAAVSDQNKAYQLLTFAHHISHSNTAQLLKISDAALNLAPTLTNSDQAYLTTAIAAQSASSDSSRLAQVAHVALSIAEKTPDDNLAVGLIDIAAQHIELDPALPAHLSDVAVKRAAQTCEPEQVLGLLAHAHRYAGEDKAQQSRIANLALASAFTFDDSNEAANAVELAYCISRDNKLPMEGVVNAALGRVYEMNDSQYSACALIEIAHKAAQDDPALTARVQDMAAARLSEAEKDKLSNDTILRYLPLLGLPKQDEGVVFAAASRSFGAVNLNAETPVFFVANHKQQSATIASSGPGLPSAVFAALAKRPMEASAENFRKARSNPALV